MEVPSRLNRSVILWLLLQLVIRPTREEPKLRCTMFSFVRSYPVFLGDSFWSDCSQRCIKLLRVQPKQLLLPRCLFEASPQNQGMIFNYKLAMSIKSVRSHEAQLWTAAKS